MDKKTTYETEVLTSGCCCSVCGSELFRGETVLARHYHDGVEFYCQEFCSYEAAAMDKRIKDVDTDGVYFSC